MTEPALVEWIEVNWWWISATLYVLMCIANAITKHYTHDKSKLWKALKIFIEFASVTTSVGAKRRGKFGYFKLPLRTVIPDYDELSEEDFDEPGL